MQKINLPGMTLTDYSLREAIGITDRFLGSGSLNTILFISAKILVGAGVLAEQQEWIRDADLIIWSNAEIAKQAGIKAKDRIREVEDQDYIKEVLQRLGREKEPLYLLAESEEDLEKLEFDLRLLREDLNIAGSGIIGGAPEEWDDEANRINTLAPTAIISWLQFDRQGRLIERMKRILNADIWLGLDPQMVLGSRKEPFLKKVLSKWYHHLFQRQLLEYHANEKGQTEESENAGEEITEEYDTESE